ncbi:MAG: hypothetical protein RIT33_685 [Pseudomonadota bacterium]
MGGFSVLLTLFGAGIPKPPGACLIAKDLAE